MQIRDRVALVTGGGGAGCGRAIARKLAELGAIIVIDDVDEWGARETLLRIEAAGGRASVCLADLRSSQDVDRLVRHAETEHGGLDILVNNASGGVNHNEPLTGWVDMIETEVTGPMRLILRAIQAMRERGGGSIVNMGSTSGLPYGRENCVPAYDAAKACMMHLTAMLAKLEETENIRVNALVPHWIASPHVAEYVASLTAEQRKARGVPTRLIPPDEIAAAVVSLIERDDLAGRVVVWRGDEAPGVIPWNDPGYRSLEPFVATGLR